ncbi:MAG: efflux RND transporter permease subunit [Gammaproteobacteria bacterium]|nr:efflux RND transporter permease subunit [Gammaproteobacteria bacterium]
MTAIIRYFVHRDLLINMISVAIVLLGLYSAWAMKREAFPNVDLDQIQVSVSYPGATSEEIERLVITPIEQELKSLSGIDKMTSVSFPGTGSITIEVDPDAKNRNRITSDVQLSVNRADLPQDLPFDPLVLEIDSSMIPVIQLAVSAPVSELELKRLGDSIEDDLLSVPGISRVTIQGPRRAEIRVVVDPQKLSEYRVSIGEIQQLLQVWNVTAPGGNIDTPEGQKVVRIVGEFDGPEDVANLVIRSTMGGGQLRLGDVATVSEALETPTRTYDVSGRSAISMIVMKRSDADIIDAVDGVRSYLETVPEIYGNEVKVEAFQDISRFTRMRLGVLTNNAMVGVFLVFTALILFLRPSVAITTTWGLPIVFLMGLFILYLNGITLNLISMMGFIMVLGMLVDDAIIVGENITYHMEKGMKPHDAAVKGASELIGPVTATVLTTITAFAPMMFVSGQIGKFIIAIPIVVILLLALSWFESFFILPSHVAYVTNPKKKPKERAWLVWLENQYAKLLDIAIRYRYMAVFLSLVVLFASFGLARTMSFQLFPAVAVDQYIVRAVAEQGTSLELMREKLNNVDRVMRSMINESNLENTIIGAGNTQMQSGDPNAQNGPRYGQIRVLYTPALTRPDHDAMDDMHMLEQKLPERFPDLELSFTELRSGPPTGRPLEAELSGNNINNTIAAAERLEKYLGTIEGVTSVESGLEAGDEEIRVVLDRELAAYAGVNLQTASTHVRAAVDGLRASTIRRGTEEVDVTIRYPEDRAQQMEQLRNLEIPNQRGGLVPLHEIAKFERSKGYSAVRHKDGIRVITVVGNINSNIITSAELNARVAEDEKEWMGDLYNKVNVNYGGEAEQNVESIRDLAASFIFALIGIFIILSVQFNNFKYPIIVMTAIPFGAIGIIVSFFVHDIVWMDMPLSFFSLLGMVALTGVVVNASLVLVVFIQRAMEEGESMRNAIMNAGRRRLRAVLLTAATTIMGLLPTAYGWGGSDPFVAPMALSLAWGLIFATVITLYIIPSIIAVGLYWTVGMFITFVLAIVALAAPVIIAKVVAGVLALGLAFYLIRCARRADPIV